MAHPPSKNKQNCANQTWDRNGDDCAFILRNLATSDGFDNWEGFTKDKVFNVFLQKYVKVNLKRNFMKTEERLKEFLENGGGDISPELREKAGLSTAKSNDQCRSGFNIAPGSDDELTDSEAELKELQGGGDNEYEQEGKPEEHPNTSDPPGQPTDTNNPSNFDAGLEYIESNFDNVVKINIHPTKNNDTMKGTFLQEDVPDHNDPSIRRKRICCFALLASGMNINKVEVSRVENSNMVSFNGKLASKVSNAKHLLGTIGKRDKNMVRCLQEVLDEILRKKNKGHHTGISWECNINMPVGLNYESGFVDPATNAFTRDPGFVNRIESDEPDVQSDTYFVTCFIMIRHAHDGGAPVREDRNRLSRLEGRSFDSGSEETESSPEVRRHSSRSSSRARPRHSSRPSRSHSRQHTRNTARSRSVRHRSSSSRGGHHRRYHDEESYSSGPHSMDWEEPPPLVTSAPARTPPRPARPSRMPTRRPSNTANSPAPTVRRSGRSSSAHSRHSTAGEEQIFHDANQQAPGSGSKRSRSSLQPSSPRRRQQLNDGTVVEESDEIQISFEDDYPDEAYVETVSEDGDNSYSDIE